MSTMAIHPTYAARPRAAARSQVRLTRRGRFVVFFVALVFVMTAALLLSARSDATGEAGQDQPTRLVMVDEGQTLWGIAGELADDGQVREMMHRIKELNALDSTMLYAGQKLYVPVTD